MPKRFPEYVLDVRKLAHVSSHRDRAPSRRRLDLVCRPLKRFLAARGTPPNVGDPRIV
jgi:hypothetical protein